MSDASSEMLSFSCRHCGKRLRAPSKAIGKRTKCPKCGHTIEVRNDPQPPEKPHANAESTPKQPDSSQKEVLPTRKTSLLEMEDPFSLDTPAIDDVGDRQRVSSEKREEKEHKRALQRRRHANHSKNAEETNNRRSVNNSPTKVPSTSTGTANQSDTRKTSSSQPNRGMPQLNEAGLVPFDDEETAANSPEHTDAPNTTSSSDSRSAQPSDQNVSPDTPVSGKGALFDGDLDLDELRLQAEAVSQQHADRPAASNANAKQPAAAGPAKNTEKRATNQGQHASSRTQNKRQSVPEPPDVDAFEDLDDLVPTPLQGALDELDDLPELMEEIVDNEYRVVCNTCGTAQYVAPSTQGMKLQCPDCHSSFKVPPPPAGWKPKTARKAAPSRRMSDAIDDELGFVPSDPAEDSADMHKRDRVQDLLEKARGEVTLEHDDEYYAADFDNANFVQRTFGFVRDPMTMVQIGIYAFVFFGVFATAQFGLNDTESQFGRGMLLITVILVPLVALLFALPMLSGGLALIESVANKQQRVEELPAFNLFDNGADLLVIALAFFASLVPGFIVGRVAGGEDLQVVFELCGMVLSGFILFPIFLLSMMDNGSIFAPVSSSVLQSIPKAAEAWGGYYLKTFVASSVVILLWLILLGRSPILAGLAGTLLPVLIFFTCQQIGVLADGIGNHLSFEFAPPKKVDEDEDVHAENRRQRMDEH